MCVAEKRAKKRSRQESWPRRVNANCAEKKKKFGRICKDHFDSGSPYTMNGSFVGDLLDDHRHAGLKISTESNKSHENNLEKRFFDPNKAARINLLLRFVGFQSVVVVLFRIRKKIKAGVQARVKLSKKRPYAIIEFA